MQKPGDTSKPRSSDPDVAPDIAALILDGDEVTRALGRAVRSAVMMHKQLGDPIAVWRDEKVVWIPPEEIEVSESDDHAAADERP